MKTFTLCSKLFTFLLLIWIFHCFYNNDFSSCLIYKDKLQMKNRLKDERMLAEGGILEKKQTCIKECSEHYPYSEGEFYLIEYVYLMYMYIKCYNTFILSRFQEHDFFIEEKEMKYKCRDKILNAYRNNISAELPLEELLLTH
ncbi:fam-g protein [Plasmodium gallinaceum]|uniref:Fam-g protein n=1 Tax=Plasmodium gallinaceum TaxID=5849 RepID=A0A1J1GZF2_PLAGA|nr:fam-g protein [Plasmodium gallinaceum]CRG97981.1 fam-g protein [Plasmodium gallinaceum]